MHRKGQMARLLSMEALLLPIDQKVPLVEVILNPEIKDIRVLMVQVSHGFLYEWSCLLLGAVYKNTFLIQLFLAACILIISMVLI